MLQLVFVIISVHVACWTFSSYTAKPLTKLVTGGGLFSTGVCPCRVAVGSPPVSFFLCSSSIFFLNISMKLPSFANAFPPGSTGAALGAAGAGLLEGDAGLPQLESPLLPPPPLLWGLLCERFESMFPGCWVHKQRKSSSSQRVDPFKLPNGELPLIFTHWLQIQPVVMQNKSSISKHLVQFRKHRVFQEAATGDQLWSVGDKNKSRRWSGC